MLTRRVMSRGKYSVASHIVYKALDTIGERTGNPPLEVFDRAIRNATPLVEVACRADASRCHWPLQWRQGYRRRGWLQLRLDVYGRRQVLGLECRA